MAKFIVKNIGEVVETRIGFRANETRRANNMIARLNSDGIMEQKIVVGKHKNGNNKWQNTPYQIPRFPLIEDNIYKDKVEKYWENKNVRFAYRNNCVGCVNRNPLFLSHIAQKDKESFKWFVKQEQRTKNKFNSEVSYKDILKFGVQNQLFDDKDFNDCDSGYCGI